MALKKWVPVSVFLPQQLAGKPSGPVANTTGPGQAEAGNPLFHIFHVTFSGHLTFTKAVTL